MITTVVADGKNEYEFIDLLKREHRIQIKCSSDCFGNHRKCCRKR